LLGLRASGCGDHSKESPEFAELTAGASKKQSAARSHIGQIAIGIAAGCNRIVCGTVLRYMPAYLTGVAEATRRRVFAQTYGSCSTHANPFGMAAAGIPPYCSTGLAPSSSVGAYPFYAALSAANIVP
jgi:hypothetical protein